MPVPVFLSRSAAGVILAEQDRWFASAGIGFVRIADADWLDRLDRGEAVELSGPHLSADADRARYNGFPYRAAAEFVVWRGRCLLARNLSGGYRTSQYKLLCCHLGRIC